MPFLKSFLYIYIFINVNIFVQLHFLQRPTLIGPCGGSVVWLQQVIWAGMHSAPPQPLAFQEQQSISNQAAFPLLSSAATWKKTCLRLIRGGGGVYSPKWLGCSRGQKETTKAATLASFSSILGYAAHCSHIVMDVGEHKALCLWANYAAESAAFCQILDSVRIVELCLAHFGRDERVLSGKNRRVSVWIRSPGQFLLLATCQESPHLPAQRLNTLESASRPHL